MSRFFKIAFLSVAVLLVTGIAGSVWMWKRTSHVPEFYKRARGQSRQATTFARNQLAHDVRIAQKQAERHDYWSASFSEEQINAWLIDELPDRFEKWFARGVSDPAIAIEDGQLFAALRYQSKGWDTVISCRLSVQMTEQPNLLAIALSDLKAGSLPLPLEPFVRRISREAALGELDIRWDFTEEGPIALVSIPQDDPQYVYSPLIIEAVYLGGAQLQLSGRAGELATKSYSPRGRVHQFVSYRTKRADPAAPKSR